MATLGDSVTNCGTAAEAKQGLHCHLSREKPHATLDGSTETHGAQLLSFLDEEMNGVRFDWTGDSQQIKVKFTAQAEFESRLSGFQSIALIWLSYSEAMKSFWFQVFISIWVRKRG